MVALYLTIYIQLLIPIYLVLGNIITIILIPIIYFIVFYTIGNTLEVVIILTILFSVASPYIRIPLYQYLEPRISRGNREDTKLYSRIRNYFLPF